MDTQQIQQQMRMRRASIDANLDVLRQTITRARRRTVPALIALASVLIAGMVWKRRTARRVVVRPAPRLLQMG